jgi:glycine C-acetyltransferase
MADLLLKKGIYVIGFSYPVVPKDKARIRVQISAAHSKQNIDYAVESFAEVKKML